jgi:hypothetical protein
MLPKRAQTWLIIADYIRLPLEARPAGTWKDLLAHGRGKEHIALTGSAKIESNQRNGVDETMRCDIYPQVSFTNQIDDSE